MAIKNSDDLINDFKALFGESDLSDEQVTFLEDLTDSTESLNSSNEQIETLKSDLADMKAKYIARFGEVKDNSGNDEGNEGGASNKPSVNTNISVDDLFN